MSRCHSEYSVIIRMHERGFEQDFQLFGNDLLWLQEKIFVRTGDFQITECHWVRSYGGNPGSLILGIFCHSYQLKGILLIREDNYRLRAPVLLKKFREWQFNSGMQYPFHRPAPKEENILQYL